MKNTLIKYNVKSNNNNLNILPGELHSILIGIMLSDGSLYRSSPNANTRFEMSFGKKYEELAFHISNLFRNYLNNPVKSIEIKGKNKNYINYRFKTKTLSIFNFYFEMFYKLDIISGKYIKIVPENIKDILDPVVLAYLIMADGNFDKGRKRVRIYTNCFNKLEVENLALAIYSNLGIYTGVLHDRNDQ